MYSNYLYSILFGLTWIPITVQGMWKSRSKEWVHTEHTRNVSLAPVRTNELGTVTHLPVPPALSVAERVSSRRA
jgi:hypothetical protein